MPSSGISVKSAVLYVVVNYPSSKDAVSLKHGLILTYMAKSEVVETSSFGSKPNVITVILTLHIFAWLLPLSMLLITPQILAVYSKHLGLTGHLKFM